MNSVGVKSFLTNYGIYILIFILAVVALGISIGAFTKKCDDDGDGHTPNKVLGRTSLSSDGSSYNCGSNACPGQCVASDGSAEWTTKCNALAPNSIANVNSLPGGDNMTGAPGRLEGCLAKYPGVNNEGSSCTWKCGQYEGENIASTQMTNASTYVPEKKTAAGVKIPGTGGVWDWANTSWTQVQKDCDAGPWASQCNINFCGNL